MTARSGVGRARREGRGAAARGVAGGVGGDRDREEGPGCVRERSTALKVLESQDSLTYRVSPPWWLGGKGSPSPR